MSRSSKLRLGFWSSTSNPRKTLQLSAMFFTTEAKYNYTAITALYSSIMARFLPIQTLLLYCTRTSIVASPVAFIAHYQEMIIAPAKVICIFAKRSIAIWNMCQTPTSDPGYPDLQGNFRSNFSCDPWPRASKETVKTFGFFYNTVYNWLYTRHPVSFIIFWYKVYTGTDVEHAKRRVLPILCLHKPREISDHYDCCLYCACLLCLSAVCQPFLSFYSHPTF